MATYEFRCDDDGPFAVVRAMGGAGVTARCPRCGDEARRVYSAPMLGRADRRLAAAVERTERSREQPRVVSAPPPRVEPGPASAPPANPAWRRLPRP